MYSFINFLKTIATALITNSHYSNIWPIESLAAGGLLGNVLFFAVSGFCLLNVKENFGKWYLKRFLRIYPIMVLFTLLTVLLGEYTLQSGKDAVRLFLYPTNYVFFVWLMLCYVVFYVIARLSRENNKILEIALAVVVCLWVLAYIVFVDKSVYCIDDVSKPFILFLYFSSMLLGALFKKHITKINKIKIPNVIMLFVSLAVYFVSKSVFAKKQSVAFLQIFNQLTILLCLFFMFLVFIGLEDWFKKLPKNLNKCVKFIAGITLHIYLVQFIIIREFETLTFPLNFLVTTISIFIAADALYFAEYYTRKAILYLLDLIKGKGKNAENKN